MGTSLKVPVRLVHYPTIAYTPAMRQAQINYAEMILSGVIDGLEEGVAGTDQCHAFLDPKDDAILSMIVWRRTEGDPVAWITQSWTAPAARNLGLHSSLYTRVCESAREQGVSHLVGNIRHDNVAMIAAAKKCGRMPTLLMMETKL